MKKGKDAVMLAKASIHEKKRFFSFPWILAFARMTWRKKLYYFAAFKIALFAVFLSVYSLAHAEPFLDIVSPEGHPKAHIRVEIAMTDAEREHGLMDRRQMAPDTGMLFVFENPAVVQMWMKNTYIPLDMLFVDKDYKVIHMERNVQPLDLTPRGPTTPDTKYVLELPANTIGIRNIELEDVLAIRDNALFTYRH